MPTWASLTNGLLVIESIRIIQPIYYPTENSVEVSESGGFESFQGPTVKTTRLNLGFVMIQLILHPHLFSGLAGRQSS